MIKQLKKNKLKYSENVSRNTISCIILKKNTDHKRFPLIQILDRLIY